MNIVYSTSELYAEPTAVSLYSLLANNINCELLDIYIIESALSDVSRQNIIGITKSFARKVKFINADSIFAKLSSHYSLELLRGGYSTYARVFISHFLPTIDRVILIDSDTLVLQSLDELWKHHMNGAVIGAVPEAVVYGKKSFHEDPQIIQNSDYYYNMGIVLFDLRSWREQRIDEILSNKLKTPQKYRIADQSIINKYISERISRIPLKFNFYTFLHGQPSKSILRRLLSKNVFNYLEIQTASASPAIIHFVGNWFERPWFDRGRSIYKDVYLSYREQTPYCNNPLWEVPNSNNYIRILDEFIAFIHRMFPLSIYLLIRYSFMQEIKKRLKLSR